MDWSKAISVILAFPVAIIGYNRIGEFPIVFFSEFASVITLMALLVSAVTLFIQATRFRCHIHRTFVFILLLFAYVHLHGRIDFNGIHDSDFHIVSINVAQFGNDTNHALGIASIIKELDPDIVVLQEFGLYYIWPNTAVVASQFSKDIGLANFHFEPQKDNIFGTAIFSKFPIDESGLVFNHASQTNEGWIHEVDVYGTKVLVANVQLESYNFQERGGSVASISKVQELQLNQVDVLIDRLANRPQSMVVGDFNAMAGSRVYNTMKRDYFDSMAEKGQGWESTYTKLPIRIDYLFHSEDLRVIEVDAITTDHSDHKVLSVHIAL